MRCDRFGLSGLADHEQLGQDGDRLQVDGKGPQDLHHVEGMIDDQRNEGRRNQEEFCEGREKRNFAIVKIICLWGYKALNSAGNYIKTLSQTRSKKFFFHRTATKSKGMNTVNSPNTDLF